MNNRKRIKRVLTLAVMAMVLLGSVANAAVLIYEPFDYTAGSDLTGAGGTGFSGAWSMTSNGTYPLFTVRAGGLSFSPLQTVGNSAYRTGSGGRAEANRVISSASQTALLADDSTIWFSVLYQRTGGTNTNSAFLIGTDTYDMSINGTLSTYAASGEGFGFGTNAGPTISAIAYDESASPIVDDSGVAAEGLKLIVGRIVWAAGGSSDTLTLYNVTDLTTAPTTPIATVTADLDQSAFDLVVLQHNNNVAIFDEIRFGLTYEEVVPAGVSAPSPDIGELVPPGNVDLGWTNADPNAPATSVYVDVWFGMDPDNLTKVVDAVENATSKTVDASDPNTYYWRVDSYVNGSATGDPIEGPLWWFIAKDDMPPVVDAGVEMITWQDEPVQLNPNVVDDGKSLLTCRWTAPSEPDVVVVFSDPNTLAPTVTIGISKPFFVPFVGNGGFEDPVLANGSETFTYPVWVEANYSLWEYIWYYVDDNWTSIRNPTIAADGFEAPEGENVGVAYTYPGYDYALTQILAETLQASTRYDLSVQVGNSGPYNEGVSLDYRVELWTGGNVGDRSFLYGSGEQTIDPNDWETVNLTYACGPNHEQLGEPLEIRLIAESYADGHAVYFDDVMFTIDGESGTFPPHTVTLTLAVHDEDNPTPVEDTMTIDVYADKCAAAIGAGLAPDAGDVNVDCMTNLKDIAEIAAAWFDVYSVTAPFEKP